MARRGGGLSRRDHGYLNSWGTIRNATPETYGSLRRQYSGNRRALQQIDVYDDNSPHAQAMRAYRKALKSGDVNAQRQWEAWFRTWYPDIGGQEDDW